MSEYAVMMCICILLGLGSTVDIVKSIFQDDAASGVAYFASGAFGLYLSIRLWGMF